MRSKLSPFPCSELGSLRRTAAPRALLASLLLLGSACGGDSTGDAGPAPGKQGGVCYYGGRCDPGLSCHENRCLRPDAGPGDSRPPGDLPSKHDGPALAACSTPKAPCKALDPCAIEASCGEDRLCRPTKLQSCDDGLACTRDLCKGLGICDNSPHDGSCVISEAGAGGKMERRCVTRGQAAPGIACMVCDDEREKYGWSPVDSYGCDDDDPCTKDDTCKGGLCVGTYFGQKCDDGLPCTLDQCDGKGGCLGSALKQDWCKIGGVCVRHGEVDATGCKACDVGQSQSAWTPLTGGCTIAGACYAVGAKQPGGCAVCDPKKSASAWTPVAAACQIAESCYLAGEKDATGCASCDPTQSTSAWTVAGAACVINRACHASGAKAPAFACASCDPGQSKLGWTPGSASCLLGGECLADGTAHASGCLRCDRAAAAGAWTAQGSASLVQALGFESGKLAGWTLSSSDPRVRFGVSDRRSGSGGFALYYGNPSEGDFRTEGTANSGSATLGPLTLPAGKAGLVLGLYLDTESGTAYDTLSLSVNGQKLWSKSAATPMRVWHQVSLDLSAFAGQAVTIAIAFNTVDANLNSGEGVFIDDLTIYGGC